MPNLILLAPMQGWCAPLDEVPDAVFAGKLLGDGVAIDPTEGVLVAPCDGEVITVAAQKHAVTLRAAGGAEVLLHVGIDTVAMDGEGFELHVAQGAQVKAGERLLTFDLDLLARRATSLVTPIIVTDGAPFSIARRVSGQSVRAGDFLMELAPAGAASNLGGHDAAASEKEHFARVVVPLEHGIHARPAAMLANRIKALAATVTVSARERTANARSAIALMSLGVRKGETVTIRAAGPDAATAVAALERAIRSAVDEATSAGTAAAPAGAMRAPFGTAATSGTAATPGTAATSGEAAMRAPPFASATGSSTAAIPMAIDASVIRGVIASPGIATGIAFRLTRPEIQVAESGAGISHEIARLESARANVRTKLSAAANRGSHSSRDIAGAHLEFLDDPELIAAADALIAHGKSAGFAWRSVLRANAEVLRSLSDARMAERVDDLLDLEQQVLAELQGEPAHHRYALPERAIVIADELLPSQFVSLEPSRVAGFCTAGGGPTSHVAVLAASLDLPMLVAAGRRVLDIRPGTPLVLDADRGELRIDPDTSQLLAAEDAVARRRTRRAADQQAASHEGRTADGTRIEVFANASSASGAATAVSHGAEGCGLLRTEFLFLDRTSAPDEATQTAEYQRIVAAFAGRPVVIRTLDVGGDKPLAYLPLPPEENPALGVRGVRVSLQHPELLRTQLRAILKVQPRGLVRVLLPMVAEVAEIHAVRTMLDEVRRELGHEAHVPLGAMIETPASAVLADQLARAADFLSIGTNDLTQYTLAIDRGNPALAARLDALHPAVLHLISIAARAGRANRRDVAVCGGLASDPSAAPILIGLGVNQLSAVPTVLPRLKALIRSVGLQACEALARRALAMESAAEVRALVAQWAADNVQEVLR